VWSRWFWKIKNGEDALRLIKSSSTTFLVLSAVQAAVSIFLIVTGADQAAYRPLSVDNLLDLFLTAILFAFFSCVLWCWNSRFAAVTLLILSILVLITRLVSQPGSAQGGPKIFFAVIAVWAGLRAVEATFKLRGRFAEAGDPSRQSGPAPPPNSGRTSAAGAQPNSRKGFDVERWNALLKYDPDIANVADQLLRFGDKWVDEFARDYLVLDDKEYLPHIFRKIVADAKREEGFANGDAETHFEKDSLNTDFRNETGGNRAAFACDKDSQAGGSPSQSEPLKGTGSRNYIARHWRGELPLPVSYWVNGLLANILAGIAVIALSRGFDFKDEFDRGVALFTITVIWVVTFLIALWQLVGNWRSATNYQQIKRFWGGATKFVIVIGAARLVVAFGQTGFPQLQEFVQIYQGDARLGTHTFKVIKEGRGLSFTGGITFGVANEFGRFLKAMPNIRMVLLDSVGGRVYEAARIGDLIKSRGLDTRVARQCMSACTTIFLSGRERTVSSKARLGFHQPDFPGLTESERATLIFNEEARLKNSGVTGEFARKANLASPADIWFPTMSELVAGGVVTNVSDLSPLAPPSAYGQIVPRNQTVDKPLDYSSLKLSEIGEPVKNTNILQTAATSPPASVPTELLARLDQAPPQSSVGRDAPPVATKTNLTSPMVLLPDLSKDRTPDQPEIAFI